MLGVTGVDDLAETTSGKRSSLAGFRQECASWNKSDQVKNLIHNSVAHQGNLFRLRTGSQGRALFSIGERCTKGIVKLRRSEQTEQMKTNMPSYSGYRFPHEIISRCCRNRLLVIDLQILLAKALAANFDLTGTGREYAGPRNIFHG
jgi:hypothetical protein